MRRELKGEGVHVLTVYPAGGDRHANDENESGRTGARVRARPASAVADATIEGIETDAFEVIRGGEARAQMIALIATIRAAIDERMLSMKTALEDAVKESLSAL